MHDRVRSAEQRAEDAVKEHQRRTKEIESQFHEKEKFLQESLRKQMQRVVAEQMKELEEMQNEF